MKGTVFNIQKFCTGDGPGIRTTVFLKGCPLACAWCHNPESQELAPETLFYPHKCVGCGRCRTPEAENPDFFCYHDAKALCGKPMTAEEILEDVLRDKPFYDTSGGGMTLSGGEPLYQPDFALELLQLAKKEGLHTAIETCGFVSPTLLERVAPFVDLFLYDYKETDPVLHREFTGVANERIVENLLMLDRMGKESVLRCPIIPGYNHRPDHLEGIAAMAGRLTHLKQIDIEPYHALGSGKYEACGRVAPEIPTLTDEEIEQIITTLQAKVAVPVKKA